MAKEHVHLMRSAKQNDSHINSEKENVFLKLKIDGFLPV